MNIWRIYEVLRIEKRRDGTYYVLDNRGENAVEAGPLPTFAAAQAEWMRQAAIILDLPIPQTA